MVLTSLATALRFIFGKYLCRPIPIKSVNESNNLEKRPTMMDFKGKYRNMDGPKDVTDWIEWHERQMSSSKLCDENLVWVFEALKFQRVS